VLGVDLEQTERVYDVSVMLQQVYHQLQRDAPAGRPSLQSRNMCLLSAFCKHGHMFLFIWLCYHWDVILKLRPSALLVGTADDIRFDSFMMAPTRQHLSGQSISSPLQLFNSKEQLRYHHYCQKWSALGPHRCAWQDLIINLGDNPNGGWTTWSANSNAIPTLRRSGGMMVAAAYQRQVLLKELYAGYGFPTYPKLAEALGVPLYNVFAEGASYTDLRRIIGNGMHIAQIGVFMGVALACHRRRELPFADVLFA
jgi:hypothetical protein